MSSFTRRLQRQRNKMGSRLGVTNTDAQKKTAVRGRRGGTNKRPQRMPAQATAAQ